VSNQAAAKPLANVRLVAFDIDGVFTDGRFYLSDDGIESKSFCTQDGFGVRQLLKSGVEVAVISGRSSPAVERRMKELGIAHIFLACGDKAAAFDTLIDKLGIGAEQAVFVGDDIPDLPLLSKVGHSFAVANAVSAVREYCTYTTKKSGGDGAVREVCELVLAAQGEDKS